MHKSIRFLPLVLPVLAFLSCQDDKSLESTTAPSQDVVVMPRILLPAGVSSLPRTDSVRVRLVTADSRTWDSVWNWDKDSAWIRGVGRSSRYSLDIEGFSGFGDDRLVRWQGSDTAQLTPDHVEYELRIGVGIFLRDSIAPSGVLSAKTPETDTLAYGADSFLVEWTVKDDSLSFVRIGDTTWNNARSGVFGRKFASIRGQTVSLILRGQDRAGNRVTRTVKRWTPPKDTVAPVVKWLGDSLRSGRLIVLADSVVLSWKIDEDWPDQVLSNNRKRLPGAGGIYRDTLRRLAKGETLSVTIQVKDLEKQEGSFQFEVVRLAPDSASPKLTFKGLVNGSLRTRSDTGSLGIEASDDSLLSLVVCGNDTLRSDSGRFTYKFKNITPGYTHIPCMARDAKGKTTRDTASLWRIDKNVPEVFPIGRSSEDTIFVLTDTTTVSFSVNDTNGIAKVTIDGDSVGLKTGVYNRKVSALAWTITRKVVCQAWNRLGNEASATLFIKRVPKDSTAPTIALAGTKDSSLIVRIPDTTLRFVAKDDSAVASVRCNDKPLDFADGAWTWNLKGISLEWLDATCTAKDGKDRPGSIAFRIRRQDLVAPVISILNPRTMDTVFATSDSTEIEWTVKDSTSLTVSVDSQTTAPVTGSTWKKALSGLTWEGVRQFTIRAVDRDGNVDTETVFVRRLALDSLPPSLVLRRAGGQTLDSILQTRSADTTLYLIATDDSLVASVTCNGDSLSQDATGWAWPLAGIGLQWDSTTCKVVDAKGRSSERTFVVRRTDLVKPVIAITTPRTVDTVLATSDSTVIEWTVKDSTSLTVSVDNLTIAPVAGSSWKKTLSGLTWEGVRKITIRAEDRDGNVDTLAVFVRRLALDSLPPSLVLSHIGGQPLDSIVQTRSTDTTLHLIATDDSLVASVTCKGDSLTQDATGWAWPLSGIGLKWDTTTCTVSDAKGRASQRTFFVRRMDLVKPKIRLVGANPNDTLRAMSDTLAISWSVTDSLPPVTATLDGTKIAPTTKDTGWTKTFKGLAWNVKTRHSIVARDTSGNVDSLVFWVKRIVRDTAAPRLRVPNLKNDTLFLDSVMQRFQLVITDDSSGLDGEPMNVEFPGYEFAVESHQDSIWTVVCASGCHPGVANFGITVQDKFGRSQSYPLPVKYKDTTLPAGVWSQPNGVWSTNKDTLTVISDSTNLIITYSDNDPNTPRSLTSWWTYTNSTTVLYPKWQSGKSYSIPLGGLQWRTIQVKAFLTDPSGNMRQCSVYVTRRDTAKPVITWNKPRLATDTLRPTFDTATISVTATDNSSVRTVLIGGVTASRKGNVWTARLQNFSTGAAAGILCEATDSFENKQTLTVPVRGKARRGAQIEIPGGTFLMGGGYTYISYVPSTPIHQVTISPFWMDTTETTSALQQSLVGGDSSNARPAFMRWVEAILLCNARSKAEGLDTVYTYTDTICEAYRIPLTLESFVDLSWDKSKNGYRLPTESEWEFAAMADSVNEGPLTNQGWVPSNSGGVFHDVATKPQNSWGLHDMLGNTSEWTWDASGTYPDGPVTNPDGPVELLGNYRVFRGGDAIQTSMETILGPRLRNCAFPNYSGPIGVRMVRSR